MKIKDTSEALFQKNLSYSDVIDYFQINEHIMCLIPSWERSYFENDPIKPDEIALIQQSDILLNMMVEFSSFSNVDMYYVFRDRDQIDKFTFSSNLHHALRLCSSFPKHLYLVRILKFEPENSEEGIITKFLKIILTPENWEKDKIFEFNTSSKSVRFYTAGLILNYIEKAKNKTLDEKSIFALEKLISFESKNFEEKNSKSGIQENIKYKVFKGLEPFLAYILNACLLSIKRCKNCSLFIPQKFQNRNYCDNNLCKKERAKKRKRKEYLNKKLNKENSK